MKTRLCAPDELAVVLGVERIETDSEPELLAAAVADEKSDDARLAILPPAEVAAVATLPPNEVTTVATLPPKEVTIVAILPAKDVTSPAAEVASEATLPAKEVISLMIESICGLGAAVTGTVDWIAKTERRTAKAEMDRIDIIMFVFFRFSFGKAE